MPKLLLVEDDTALARGLQFNLDQEGFEVTVVDDGRVASDRVQKEKFDLVVLDGMLPGMDGTEVVRSMRKADNYTPVLMLTARSLPDDHMRGLEAGADDYLTKPFDFRVLLAHINGLLRREQWLKGNGSTGTGGPVRMGVATVDFARHELVREGEHHTLTMKEAMLLKLFATNPGRLVPRAELLEKVWDLRPDTNTRTADAFIVRLRRFIEKDPVEPQYLVTVRGLGYRYDPEGSGEPPASM
ncbi:MAG: response regulator transcription factor [Deltaproteobacteria bacterium]|nr:response regulator transcription factor [Deltaproteobacteria bacterium]